MYPYISECIEKYCGLTRIKQEYLVTSVGFGSLDLLLGDLEAVRSTYTSEVTWMNSQLSALEKKLRVLDYLG